MTNINILTLLMCCLISCTTSHPTKNHIQPNIILIMADDLGWKELGSYGQKKIKTPHLDQMAKEGMRFTQFYAGSAVCAPSRCNLMTGKHGGHAFVRNNLEIKNNDPDFYGGQHPLPESEITVAELLQKNGYVTGCFGKWGLGAIGSTGDPLKKGFDRFYGYNCQRNAHNLYPKYLESDNTTVSLKGNTRSQTGKLYAPQLIADEMITFIKNNKDKPFFCYYPTVIPHLPLQAPKEDIKKYVGLWDETAYTGKYYQKHDLPRACYAAMISFMDKQIGRLYKTLKDLDIDNNTLVLFTSDNGTTYLKGQVDYDFFQSVGPLRGLKGSLHEGGIRVPLIVRWKGKIKENSVSDHISANYDIFNTLLDITNIKHSVTTDSLSFKATLLNSPQKQKKHDYLFWDFIGYSGQLAIRKGKWKAIKKNLIKNPNAPLELYNLNSDISESKNISTQHPDIVKAMEKIMLEARTKPSVKNFQFGKY